MINDPTRHSTSKIEVANSATTGENSGSVIGTGRAISNFQQPSNPQGVGLSERGLTTVDEIRAGLAKAAEEHPVDSIIKAASAAIGK